MLSLDTFTTEELSRFCRVGLPTVRTVMDRNASWLDEVGVEPTNRRGGQPKRYRLTADGRRALEATVAETNQTLQNSGGFIDSVRSIIPLRDSQIPLGLRMAHDTLTRLIPEETGFEEKLKLLEIAEREAQGALQETPDQDLSLSRRIEREVQSTLARVAKMRAEIERKTVPDFDWTFAFNGHPAVQLLAGIPMKASLTKRVMRDLKGTEIHLSPVKENAEVPFELTDAAPVTHESLAAVILLVDSSDYKKARTQFDCALVFSSMVSRPLAILDKGYDTNFRNDVYSKGIRVYCPDAGGLNSQGMRGLVGSFLATEARLFTGQG